MKIKLLIRGECKTCIKESGLPQRLRHDPHEYDLEFKDHIYDLTKIHEVKGLIDFMQTYPSIESYEVIE